MSAFFTRASVAAFAGSGGWTNLGAPLATEVNLARSYFASIYTPGWDGGYDIDRYPSYGADWPRSGRTAVARLEALGV